MDALTVTVAMCKDVHLAQLHNKKTIISSIELLNTSAHTLRDITLEISSQPETLSSTISIAEIKPQELYCITEIDLHHRAYPFSEIPQLQEAQLIFSITYSYGNNNTSYTQKVVEDTTFLPALYWPGETYPKELLASFIQPQDPAIQHLKDEIDHRVSPEDNDTPPPTERTFEEVTELTQKVYHLLQGLKLKKVVPPHSFVSQGQHLHSFSSLLTSKAATPLELALLTASLFEALQLQSLLFLTKSTVFVGVMPLQKDTPTLHSINSSQLYFEDLIRENKLIVLDIAHCSAEVTFEEACQKGKKLLTQEKRFITGLIVASIRRYNHYFPLNEEYQLLKATQPAVNTPEIVVPTESLLSTPTTAWCNKLLDLSYRNALIHLKEKSTMIKLQTPGIPELITPVNSGVNFKILPSNRDKNAAPLDEEAQKTLINDYAQKHQFLTTLTPNEYHKNLTKLYRSTTSSLEESGVNSLFLTIGVLKWYDQEKEKQSQGPLLLIPVELVKTQGHNAFALKKRDEDALFNSTLFEKLKNLFNLDFSPLSAINLTQESLPIQAIFDTTKHIITQNLTLDDEMWFGEFSFQKYLMWNELKKHTPEMLKSPVVSRLLENTPLEQQELVHLEDLKEQYHLAQTFTPLPADSSQLAAIISAEKGCSFVLQGPPGTGKSQTITNMIANLLGHNKSVLFVSEKRVALEVVYRRLTSIGLKDQCLELHSKGSSKKRVINSFYTALTRHLPKTNSSWEEKSSRVEKIQQELTTYFSHLHSCEKEDFSLYNAFMKSKIGSDCATLNFNPQKIFSLSSQELQDARTRVEDLLTGITDIEEEHYFRWNSCSDTQWTIHKEEELKSTLNTLLQALDNRNILATQQLPLPIDTTWNQLQWQEYYSLLTAISTPLTISAHFLEDTNWKKSSKSLSVHLKQIEAYLQSYAALEEICDMAILQVNLTPLRQLERESRESSFLIRSIRKFQFNKALNPFLIEPKTEHRALELALSLTQGKEEYAESCKVLSTWFTEPLTLTSLPQAQEDLLRATTFYSQFFSLYSENQATLPANIEYVVSMLSNADTTLDKGTPLYQRTQEMLTTLTSIHDSFTHLTTTFHFNDSLKSVPNDILQSQISAMHATTQKYLRICELNDIKKRLTDLSFKPLISALDEKTISLEQSEEIFEASLYSAWLSYKLANTPEVQGRSGSSLNRLSQLFEDSFKAYQEASKIELQKKLSIPHATQDIVDSSPIGIIQAQNSKSRNHMPTRSFLQEIKPIATKIKPCFLMSPTSVSQYLELAPLFDVVIFDEASQIQPWDAISALARGKSAIVVGDAKQLPPTTFFKEQMETTNDELDSESILDLFSRWYPEISLKWHYRSRSEELIAFSNHHFYHNSLQTFPNTKTHDRAITLTVIEDAHYDRSNTRTNPKEAKALVQELFELINDPYHSNSIGVVTFSQVQADCIRDLIDKETQNKSSLQELFNPENPNYIFVKSLEMVQGDERDTILFSIGYGKNSKGVLHASFGPLNNIGGERRLNVAITRAQRNIRIFSNFHPHELSIENSTSHGLKLLKNYLHYASAKTSPTLHNPQESTPQISLFTQLISDSLKHHGWKVHTNIGTSTYRIDIALEHPDNPEEFFVGIETDGPRYHTAFTAQDREFGRKNVLQSLGWNIIRVWSADWWHDSEDASKQLNRQLNELLASLKETTPLEHKHEEETEIAEWEEYTEEEEDLEFTDTTPLYTKEELYNLTPEEIAQILLPIIEKNISAKPRDIYKLVHTQTFGGKLLSSKAEKHLKKGILLLVKQGAVDLDDTLVTLRNE